MIIIGLGNELRGEDAFGIDVIKELEKKSLINIKLIKAMQLLPEMCLELKDAKKLIIIDAAYSSKNSYKLASPLKRVYENSISHHINIDTILAMTETLYNRKIDFEIFSMLSNNFENIENKKSYQRCIDKTVEFLTANF